MTWERILEGGPDRGAPLGEAYRPIRRVSEAESPLPGELAAVGGDVVLLVDAGELVGWPGWAHGESQHVLGVRDVVRRDGGHDAALPRCGARLDAAVRAAEAGGAGLSGGEAVTLAVSLLRGVEEVRRVARGGEQPGGAWWLLADGRPAFVPARSGEGDGSGAAAARLLSDAAAGVEDRVVRRLLDEACTALEDAHAAAADVEALEEKLFAACAPRPLERLLSVAPGALGEAAAPGRDPVAAGAARGARTRRDLRPARSRRAPRARADAAAGSERHGGAGLDVREIVDAALAGRVAEGISDALAGTRRRLGALRERRGAPMLLGAVAAGAVVAVGLAWPAGDEPAAAQHADAAAPGAAEPSAGSPGESVPPPETGGGAGEAAGEAEEGAASPAPEEAESSGEGEDAMAAANRLLDGLAVCEAAGDADCAAVRAPGAAPVALPDHAAARLPPAEREVTLLDDFGDVAVLRVDASDPGSDATAQSLVIERQHAAGGRWLIRDVHELPTETAEGTG